MLSGLAVCAECGGPLWLSWSGPSEYPHLKRQYYRETSKIRQRPCANRGSGWDAESAEAQVSAVIEGWRWIRSGARLTGAAAAFEGCVRGRAFEPGAGAEACDAGVHRGALGEEEWRRVTEAIDERLVRCRLRCRVVCCRVGGLRSVGQVWAGMTVEERREGARLLFERVELDTRGRRLWVKPWAEVEGVFRDRREWIVSSAPRQVPSAIDQPIQAVAVHAARVGGGVSTRCMTCPAVIAHGDRCARCRAELRAQRGGSATAQQRQRLATIAEHGAGLLELWGRVHDRSWAYASGGRPRSANRAGGTNAPDNRIDSLPTV